jgi:tetratricopeptide (TPR) repeat protein/predicted Ser/Thr protein kinase
MDPLSPEPVSHPTLPAAPSQELLEPGRVIGRFRVRKLAGMGGMGEVYQAWDPLLERYVALKAVRPSREAPEENLERFRREALALAQLSHPHVCQVYDLVTSEVGTFIAMEWLEGQTLDAAARGMNRREKLRIIQDVADGLAAAHAKGLVHRDLKPSNIMVDLEGRPKILDFGLARHLSEPSDAPVGLQESSRSESEARDQPALDESQLPTGLIRTLGKSSSSSSRFSDPLTQQGFFMGSPRYASPEQIRGHLAGAPSDVFSLGVLLWELLAGEHPYPGEGQERFEAVVANRRKPLRTQISRSLNALLNGMLAMHPKDRLTAAEVAHGIHRVLRPLGGWGIASLSTGITAALGILGYVLLGRGVVSDLVRERPAGIAILPVVNRTGDPSLVAELRWLLPDLLSSGLRASPRLRVIPLEEIATVAKTPENPLAADEVQRLERRLGADLCLASELQRAAGGGWLLTLRLIGPNGKVRFEDRVSRDKGGLLDLQILARQAARDVVHAVDPLGKGPQDSEVQIPPEAFQEYAEGKELMDRGSFREALPHLKSAASGAPFFASAAVQYGICLQKLGDPSCDMAIQWGRMAGRASGNRRSEIQAITQLALLRMEQGRWDESQRAFAEAMEIARSLGDEDFQAALLNNLGFLALERKRPQEAEEHLGHALAIQRRLGKRGDEMLTLNNLAVIAKERGDFSVAQAHYRLVLDRSREVGDRWAESIALNNLGDVAIGQGAFSQAEAYFQESVKLKRLIGHRSGLIIPMTNLGILARIQGDHDRSKNYLAEALALSREVKRVPMEATILFQMGCLDLARAQASQAIQHFQEAADHHRHLASNVELAQDLAGMVEARLVPGRGAIGHLLGQLQEARRLDPQNPFVLRAEAQVLRAQGQTSAATERLGMALNQARKLAPEEVPGIQALMGAH